MTGNDASAPRRIMDLNAEVVRLHGRAGFEDALPWAREAASLARRHTWRHRPELASSLANVVCVLMEVGTYAEARVGYHEAPQMHHESPVLMVWQLAMTLNKNAGRPAWADRDHRRTSRRRWCGAAWPGGPIAVTWPRTTSSMAVACRHAQLMLTRSITTPMMAGAYLLSPRAGREPDRSAFAPGAAASASAATTAAASILALVSRSVAAA